jgi:ribose transport system ATP-binding protein
VKPLLRVEGISKAFAGNRVLQDVTFEVERGEIHAVVGENGAGKSTLIKIIGSIYQADAGTLTLDGQTASFATPAQAMRHGISIVHQELSLVPNLTVAQNIFIGNEARGPLGLINWRDLNKRASELLRRVGARVDPTELVGELSVGTQQIIEIAKALALDAKVIILDEPTSSLSENEVDLLYKLLDDLRGKGMGIVFISHKLGEVFRLADRISVLRDGKLVGTKRASETTTAEVIHMMVGRHIADLYPSKSSESGAVLLEVKDFSCPPYRRPVSFELRRGEILGFAGLVGAGRTELARAIFGAAPHDAGTVTLDGTVLDVRSPRSAIEQGIAYLTEDRKTLGLFLDEPIHRNVVSASLKRFSDRSQMLRTGAIRAEAEAWVGNLDIRPTDVDAEVLNLSGGNQQKTLLAKWLCARPRILIVDEPTRGVDVGAKAHIHQELRNLAEQGIGVIVISSDLPEVLGLSDRVIVFREGELAATLQGADATQENVMSHAAQ